MDCTGVASHLVAYHFATVSDEERDAVDAHLLGCRTCLEAYFALKRATNKSPLERPSARVRERLRADVMDAFPPKSRARLLARRIPLYQGLAAAAIAAAIALVVPSLLRAHERRAVPEGEAQIDSARPRAESLQIY